MAAKYVFDSNIFIGLERRQPNITVSNDNLFRKDNL